MIGVVLGSGLGAFADTLDDRVEIPYSAIPGWPASTAVGHAGKLVEGRIGETKVIVLGGRAHLYEGYSAQQVTFGIRELARRGVKSLVLTNAAGGINEKYRPGDLVLISDHINLLGTNPLTGPNDDSLGPRFPDMTRSVFERVSRDGEAGGSRIGDCAGGGRLRGDTRAKLRNSGGDSLYADDRRGPGGDVDGAGDDRGESHGDEGPGDFVRNERCGGDFAAEAGA